MNSSTVARIKRLVYYHSQNKKLIFHKISFCRTAIFCCHPTAPRGEAQGQFVIPPFSERWGLWRAGGRTHGVVCSSHSPWGTSWRSCHELIGRRFASTPDKNQARRHFYPGSRACRER